MGDSEMESNQRLASRVRRDPSANLSTGKTGKRPSEKQILLEEVEEHFPCRRFSNAPDKESDKTVLSYSKVCDLIKLVFPNTDINDKVTSIEYENCDLIPVSDKNNVKVRMYSNVRQEEYRRFLRFSGKQEKLKDFLLTSRINSI